MKMKNYIQASDVPYLGVVDGDARVGAVSKRVGERKFKTKMLTTSHFETRQRAKIVIGFAESAKPPPVRRGARTPSSGSSSGIDSDDDDSGGGGGGGVQPVGRTKKQNARQAEWEKTALLNKMHELSKTRAFQTHERFDGKRLTPIVLGKWVSKMLDPNSIFHDYNPCDPKSGGTGWVVKDDWRDQVPLAIGFDKLGGL